MKYLDRFVKWVTTFESRRKLLAPSEQELRVMAQVEDALARTEQTVVSFKKKHRNLHLEPHRGAKVTEG